MDHTALLQYVTGVIGLFLSSPWPEWCWGSTSLPFIRF